MERWECLVMTERFVISIDRDYGEVYIKEMPERLRHGELFGVYGAYSVASYSMPEFSPSEQRIYIRGDEEDDDDRPIECGRYNIDEVKRSLQLFCKAQKMLFIVQGESTVLGEI